MASSSRLAPIAVVQRARPQSDVFKPRFPKDPFVAGNVREPWFIRPDALPSITSSSRRDAILVLGAPTSKDLDVLLSSKHLSNSLLIIASHQTLAIPHTALPTVRILRLSEPLAIEHAGAVRFVNVLEWAERVARLWRKHGGFGAVELLEDSDGQEHLPTHSLLCSRESYSTPPSPRASATHLAVDPRASSASHLSTDARSYRPRTLSRFLSRTRVPSLPDVDPSQRPFDGLINFLPKDISDKALLKQSILVTTISRPFLTATISRSADRARRKSTMSSRSSASVYLPPTPPYQSGEFLCTAPLPPMKAHLVHVLPGEARSFNSFARSKLVQSLESFLISFAYPTSLSMVNSSDDTDRPRPYIMTSSSVGERITPNSSKASAGSPYSSWSSDFSLTELVLCGSLDGDDPQLQGTRVVARASPRAYLSRAMDIVVLPEDVPLPPAVLVSQSEPFPTINLGHAGNRNNRHSSLSSSSLRSLPLTPSVRSISTGSPLARGERIINLNGLPTPPDSDESGVECGNEDLREYSRKTIGSSSPAVIVSDTTSGQSKSKSLRWKFWKRSVSIC
ncbi:hypothetical protein PHLCEN_2v1202 [Hermanssonia centrifuga]|uniref:Uncharacterized protein n=1 Tax=Hermanssonia centrifuga TaxID=98765 RepID=A0A2R6S3Y3_9APHY|nr:hypothetical protein PHLCEN_2v1202 [Hermanssonia centrifuga]